MSIKLGYPINAKSQRFCKMSPFEFGQEQKWPSLTSLKNDKNPLFCLQLYYRNHRCKNQKPAIVHSEIQSLFKLGSDFFVLIRFPGRSLWYSASWPCLDFQHHDCIARWEKARIFDGVRSSLHFFFFHIYADTSTFHGNFALVVIFIGRKFQNLNCLGKKFISSRVPKLLRFGAAILISSSTSKKPNSPTKKI